MRFIEGNRNVDELTLVLQKEEVKRLVKLLRPVAGRTLDAPFIDEWDVVGDPSDATGYGGKRGKRLDIVVLPEDFRHRKEFFQERYTKALIKAIFKDE